MPIMEISIVPIGTDATSLSEYVANAIKILKKNKSLKYQLTPMGTIVESNTIEELFNIATEMHNTAFSNKIARVVTTIKIDDRKDKKLDMDNKVESVNQKIG